MTLALQFYKSALLLPKSHTCRKVITSDFGENELKNLKRSRICVDLGSANSAELGTDLGGRKAEHYSHPCP